METREIWKFMLGIEAVQSVPMPSGAEVLTCQMQGDHLQLWAIVEPDNKKVNRTFLIVGTGHAMPQEFGRYVGTVQMAGGALVWHVFEAK